MRYLELTLFRYFALEFIAVFHLRECSCTRQARQNAPPECAFQRSWTVIPDHRGQRRGFGGDGRRFFSSVHDELLVSPGFRVRV